MREIKGFVYLGEYILRIESVSGTDTDYRYYRAGGGLTCQHSWGSGITYNDPDVVLKARVINAEENGAMHLRLVWTSLVRALEEVVLPGKTLEIGRDRNGRMSILRINQLGQVHEYPYYLSKNAKLVEDISFSLEDQFFIFLKKGLHLIVETKLLI